MELSKARDAVEQFHKRIGAPIADKPQLLAGRPSSASRLGTLVLNLAKLAARESEGRDDPVLNRAALALEEMSEWLQAHAEGDLTAAADAWADRLYVLLGDAVATGLPVEELFEATHRSNLTKAQGVTTGVGKAVKLPGFEQPQIEQALRETATGNRPRNHLASSTLTPS